MGDVCGFHDDGEIALWQFVRARSALATIGSLASPINDGRACARATEATESQMQLRVCRIDESEVIVPEVGDEQANVSLTQCQGW